MAHTKGVSSSQWSIRGWQANKKRPAGSCIPQIESIMRISARLDDDAELQIGGAAVLAKNSDTTQMTFRKKSVHIALVQDGKLKPTKTEIMAKEAKEAAAPQAFNLPSALEVSPFVLSCLVSPFAAFMHRISCSLGGLACYLPPPLSPAGPRLYN